MSHVCNRRFNKRAFVWFSTSLRNSRGLSRQSSPNAVLRERGRRFPDEIAFLKASAMALIGLLVVARKLASSTLDVSRPCGDAVLHGPWRLDRRGVVASDSMSFLDVYRRANIF